MLKKKPSKLSKDAISEETSSALKKSVIGEYHETLISKLLEKNKELKKTNKTLKKEIADRKRAEEQLIHVEKILESAVDAIDEGFVIHDMTDIILSANNAAAAILGLTTEQLLGKDSFDPRWKALHEDGTPFEPLEHPSMITLRTGQPVNNVIMNVHIGNDFRKWISINSRPVFDRDKNQTGAVATFRDITERKITLNKLINSETRYRTLFEGARDTIFLLDVKGRIIDANSAMVELFGYDEKSEVLNLSIWDISPKTQSDGSISKSFVLKKLKSIELGDTELLTWDHQKKDGTIFKTEVSTSILQYDNNTYILASVRDISDRVKSEVALKESEEKFYNAFNSSPVALSIINVKTGKRLDVNTKFCELFGLDHDEAIKGSIFKNNLAINQTQFKNTVKKLKKTGRLWNTPLSLKDGLGKVLDTLINATNTVSKDKDIFIVSYMDMTEIKEAEEKIKKVEARVFETMINSEEKERARYAKELHDGLGPIISTSMIYLHTLQEEEDKAKRQEYLDRSYSLLEDATQTIREISMNLSPDILTKYGLVQAIRSFIEKLRALTGIQFEISSNITSELPYTVRFTIYRALTELINNSIKHAEATKIQLIFVEVSQRISISYTDDGKGFDYNKTIDENKGFGLMNIETRIMKTGGHYDIQSKKDKGTQVNINLPKHTYVTNSNH